MDDHHATPWHDTEESPLAVTLPYDFDTIALPRKILAATVAGSALMMLFALVNAHQERPAGRSPLSARCLASGVGRRQIHRQLSTGRRQGSDQPGCRRDRAERARPAAPSRSGRNVSAWPIQGRPRDLRRARRRELAGAIFSRQVYLIGRDGTADICVASERDTTAKALAPEIAAAVGLPFEHEGLVPFDH